MSPLVRYHIQVTRQDCMTGITLPFSTVRLANQKEGYASSPMTFPKRVQYNTCPMVYKSITGQAPEYISSMLTYVSEHHERQTSSTALDLLYIPGSHSAYFDRAFSVQGPKLWNSLPADIRNSTSINRFKAEAFFGVQ